MTNSKSKSLAALARQYHKNGIDSRDARKTAETVIPVLGQAIMDAAPELGVIASDRVANQMVYTAALYIAANKEM